MLPIAALILTEDAPAPASGTDRVEHAALAAQRAGISYVYFTGPRQPNLALLRRLRAQGVFGGDLLGWPRRLFSGLVPARQVVVLDARLPIEAWAVERVLRASALAPDSAVLAVDIGGIRKSNIIDVDGERIASVVGDGNAASAGIAVIPHALLSRVLQVRTMTDAIHRLAKTGDLRAVTVEREAASAQPASLVAAFARAQTVVREFFAQRLLPMRS
jgi:hypothetical protein